MSTESTEKTQEYRAIFDHISKASDFIAQSDMFTRQNVVDALNDMRVRLLQEQRNGVYYKVRALADGYLVLLDARECLRRNEPYKRMASYQNDSLDAVFRYLTNRLNAVFEDIKLVSVLEFHDIAYQYKIPDYQREAILIALQRVHDANNDSDRLDQLCELESVMRHYGNNPAIVKLRTTTHEIIKILFNARNDDDLAVCYVHRSMMRDY
ncbi:MAG: hypothetical protein KDH94_07615, partial [Coxiellaceae bacterium]|nr:hypothetical protein [Coxiellaceae bacterium]